MTVSEKGFRGSGSMLTLRDLVHGFEHERDNNQKDKRMIKEL